MKKALKIERVILKDPTDIRTDTETRPERVLACGRYDLSMDGDKFIIVRIKNFCTYIPMSNVKSIIVIDE